MELSIIIEDKKGVINITSEQFIIEDLKAHICSKMGLEQSEYKVAVKCGLSPILELVKVPSLKMKVEKKEEHKKDYTEVREGIKQELRSHWDGLKLVADIDIMRITNATENTREEMAIIREYKYRIVIEMKSKNNEQYFVGLKKSEVYLIFPRSERNNSLSFIKLFDMKNQKSVDTFMQRTSKEELLDYWGNPYKRYTKQEKRVLNDISNYYWNNKKIDVDVIQFSKDMDNIYIGFKNTRADFKPLIINDLGNPILSFSHRDFSRDEVKEIAQLITSNREGK